MNEPPVEAARAPVGRMQHRRSDLVAAILRLRRLGDLSPRRERQLVAIAAVVFAAATIVAVLNMPPVVGGIRWSPLLVLTFVAYPTMVIGMAVQYVVAARFVGARVGLVHASRIAVISAAANMLPVPGSILVRTAGLRAHGTSFGRSLSASTAVGFAWLAMTGIAAGAVLVADGRPGTGLAFLAIGCLVTAVYVVWVHRLRTPHGLFDAMLCGLGSGVAVALVAGLNLFLVLISLRVDASFPQALAVSASGVLASTVGVFPGGLGLREVLAAGLAANVGLTAAVGAVATALARVSAMVVLAVAAIVLLRSGDAGTIRKARRNAAGREPREQR